MNRPSSPSPRLLALAACLGLLGLASACAQSVGDIDRTQPNKVRKSELEGIWYMMETVTGVPATTRATFEGETSSTEKIVWRIEEDYLLAFRAYPLVPGTEDVDRRIDTFAPDYSGESPIAAFPIKSHFDVQRSYDTSTGEEANVIIENTSDRPWYEREYIRVDWSTNAVTNFNFISDWLATPISATYSIDTERDQERSIYYEYTGNELVYFDVPRRLLVEPDIWGCIYYWYGWDYEDCTAAEVEVVTSFAKTERRRDYEPLDYDDRHMTRFGYFRSERYVYDYQRGVLESTRSRQANRHNLWEESYEKNRDGTLRRNDDGRLIPIPLSERQERTIRYYMNKEFPEDDLVVSAAFDTMDQWNLVGREAVAQAKGVSLDEVGDVFVLCRNPVTSDDHDACGDPGFTVRPGDLRYSTLHWVESDQLLGPLGYGPSAADPETGETISGRAYVYGGGINYYASRGVDIIRFINGDLDPEELQNAEHVREAVLGRARDNVDLGRVAPELKNVRLDSRRVREPSKMVRREQHKRNLVPFDRGAVERKMTRARDAGLGSIIAGEEFERAVAARSGGVSRDQMPETRRAATDPTNWLNPTQIKAFRDWRMGHLARGVDYPDMLGIDNKVAGIAKSYEGREDYDEIWRELRAEIFKATALHEVGHTVGLRHNFQASYDALNYHDRYWELRTENLIEAETYFDLYDLAAVTDAQIEGQMREYQYASIMDYGATFNSDLQGLGKYDRAAFVYAYSAGSTEGSGAECDGPNAVTTDDGCTVHRNGFVEVFNKPLSELGDSGQIMASTDEFGQPFDDPTTPLVNYLERWHYSTIMHGFDDMNDAFDRRWMRIDDVVAQRDAGDDRPVRVPYLFCSDEWVGAMLSCQVFDAGADPYEMTKNVIDDYRAYYYFRNFKRDRLGWDPINTLFTEFYYTFLPLSDYYQNWYLAPEGADEVLDNYYWLATNMGFNLIIESLATPPYGSFCTSKDGHLFHLSDEPGLEPGLGSAFLENVYCDVDQPYGEVPQGQGRRRFSSYDVDSGYLFGYYPLEAGHYWTTLAAFWALVDPEAFVIGTDADVGTFAISYYDFFADEVEEIVNAVVNENYAVFSPRMRLTSGDGEMRRGDLRYPVARAVFDPDTRVLFNPETGETTADLGGPSTAPRTVCQLCEANSECHGNDAGEVYCQPIGDGDELYCLTDCLNNPDACSGNEECDERGNCVPTDGTCEEADCDADNPHGACPQGRSCFHGECRQTWPVVETDSTFSIVDDMVFYGMFYTTFGFSTRYNDQLNVFRMGTAEEVVPGEGFEVMSFTDPISGEAYGAIVESCGDDLEPYTAGSASVCAPCEEDSECAGHTGFLEGTFCQPLEGGSDELYCLVDCTQSECPDGYTCNSASNCIPDRAIISCSGRQVECSPTEPFGACPEDTTCFGGECVPNGSSRCRFGFNEMGGAAQMVMRGQELAREFDRTFGAYWADDGSDPERELQLYREYARAEFDLEFHLSKINIIRAVYAIFGKVY